MTSKSKLSIACPTCKKKIIWEEQPTTRPFCCERCKLIDLGEWASEKNKIPGESINIEFDLETSFNDDPFLH